MRTFTNILGICTLAATLSLPLIAQDNNPQNTGSEQKQLHKNEKAAKAQAKSDKAQRKALHKEDKASKEQSKAEKHAEKDNTTPPPQ